MKSSLPNLIDHETPIRVTNNRHRRLSEPVLLFVILSPG